MVSSLKELANSIRVKNEAKNNNKKLKQNERLIIKNLSYNSIAYGLINEDAATLKTLMRMIAYLEKGKITEHLTITDATGRIVATKEHFENNGYEKMINTLAYHTTIYKQQFGKELKIANINDELKVFEELSRAKMPISEINTLINDTLNVYSKYPYNTSQIFSNDPEKELNFTFIATLLRTINDYGLDDKYRQMVMDSYYKGLNNFENIYELSKNSIISSDMILSNLVLKAISNGIFNANLVDSYEWLYKIIAWGLHSREGSINSLLGILFSEVLDAGALYSQLSSNNEYLELLSIGFLEKISAASIDDSIPIDWWLELNSTYITDEIVEEELNK